jgi:hypothetical protein
VTDIREAGNIILNNIAGIVPYRKNLPLEIKRFYMGWPGAI